MKQKKILIYLGVGAIAIAGGYFIFKQMKSGAATKGARDMLAGVGARAMSSLGVSSGSSPMVGKQEAMLDNSLKVAESPVPGHSPKTQIPKVSGAPINLSKASVASTAGTGKSTPVIQPASYKAPTAGRGTVSTPRAQRGMLSRPVAKTSAIPKIARPTSTAPQRTSRATRFSRSRTTRSVPGVSGRVY